jgi:hypothetical protein
VAKVYLKALKPFTRRVGTSVVVGHPKHPDVNGRYAAVEEGAAADALVAGGFAEKVSLETYRKNVEDVRLHAGDVRKAQLAGDLPKVSMAMSTATLRDEATKRGVDISAAKNRSEMVKAINAAGTAGAVKADNVEGTDNANSKLAGLTADTTNHGGPSSPQNPDPTSSGAPAGDTDLVADEDAAPTGGDGDGSGADDGA